MCKKCAELKRVWWIRQKLLYDSLDKPIDAASRATRYERNVAWRALFLQRYKHENRYYKVDVVQAFDVLPERTQ